jgi:hypothetical protein
VLKTGSKERPATVRCSPLRPPRAQRPAAAARARQRLNSYVFLPQRHAAVTPLPPQRPAAANLKLKCKLKLTEPCAGSCAGIYIYLPHADRGNAATHSICYLHGHPWPCGPASRHLNLLCVFPFVSLPQRRAAAARVY